MDHHLKIWNDLEARMSEGDFWNLPEEERNEVIERLKLSKSFAEPLVKLKDELDDIQVLYDLACEENEPSIFIEINEQLQKCKQEIQNLTLKATFAEKEDGYNAFLTIQAGAGGTDACDWAEILLRMYTRYGERKRFKLDLLDHQPESEGGIKSAMLHIQGKWAYGYLKSESGVHRLIRISPYDSSGRRHTSFASLHVVPEFTDELSIDILEKDLKIDFYRASGAGGQHVNVTDSAVRITHKPSGIVVCCQNERSQHKNRAMAMKILMARLYQRKKEEQAQKIEKQYGSKSSVSWSNQIRSYFLHPYTLVKDHRTGCETGNAQAVLDGEIQNFIEAYLLST